MPLEVFFVSNKQHPSCLRFKTIDRGPSLLQQNDIIETESIVAVKRADLVDQFRWTEPCNNNNNNNNNVDQFRWTEPCNNNNNNNNKC